eukprot:1300030-Ditylum_brightwellii.AAC.1
MQMSNQETSLPPLSLSLTCSIRTPQLTSGMQRLRIKHRVSSLTKTSRPRKNNYASTACTPGKVLDLRHSGGYKQAQ